MRLAHLSDIHFGRIASPDLVDALLDRVHAEDVDLVVVSGDLTQRARAGQYRRARAFLDAIEPPVVVVPGNHDVPAWYRPIDRMLNPLGRYRRYISPDLTVTHEAPGLAVFGLNSAHGWTFKGGRIRTEDLERMETFFARQPAEAFRVLVLHHHLLRLETLAPHDISRGAEAALRACARSRVELVLCGHQHMSHVEQIAFDGHLFVIASAGTATSDRGRRSDRGRNTFNLIDVEPHAFRVEELLFDPDLHTFKRLREHTFARRAAGETDARGSAA